MNYSEFDVKKIEFLVNQLFCWVKNTDVPADNKDAYGGKICATHDCRSVSIYAWSTFFIRAATEKDKWLVQSSLSISIV